MTKTKKKIQKINIIFVCILMITTTSLVTAECIKNQTMKTTSVEEWILAEKLLASDGENDDWFGFSIDIDRDYAIIGARWDDVNSIVNAGSAYIFKYNGTHWVEEAKLYAPDGEEGDWFGHAVSIYEDYAFISAASDETTGKASGSVYVFKRNGTTWTQEQKIVVSPSGGDTTIDFGWSLCMQGDYALVGAINDNDLGDSSGSVYVFKNDGSTWNLEQKLLPADGKAYAYFGYCISIYNDMAVIGARCDNYIGAAYIYKLDGSTWIEEQKLVSADGTSGDYFGRSVSMDEDYLIVGAHCDDDNGEDSGSAYIFKYDGSSWIQHAKLIASDGEPEEEFGSAVSINGDHALIGVKFDSENGLYSGSAYIFKKENENWIEQIKILPPDGGFWEHFGNAVYLRNNQAFIGAQYDDENGQYSGSTYIYERIVKEPDLDCTGSLSWTEIKPGETITANITVENIGEEGSLLDWEIDVYPTWGEWTFEPISGVDLPAGESTIVEITIIAPDEENEDFEGEIKIINTENISDYDTIDVHLQTPQNLNLPTFLEYLIHRFPLLGNLLKALQTLLQ